MGGSEPPYLYTPTTRPVSYPYSDFNPKAATQAAWQRASLASQPKPKQDGPLVDFNKHPDSYMIVQGNQTEWKPLPPNTKKAIVVTRWVQFALRVVQCIGALGLLVCVICIKGMETAVGWLVRVPVGPAVGGKL